MAKFSIVIAALWLYLQLASALTPSYDLLRVPRHVWDTEHVKRADDATSIILADHEEFMWASTNEPNQKAVVVSMVAYSKQDERILDMDKFSFALGSASCNEGDMSLTFKHKLIYQAAKLAWQWVNFNELRSFVLVPSWSGCGQDKSHDPWVVKGVQFDDKVQKVTLDATLSTWKKVMNTVVLDFGEVVLGGDNSKRDIIPDLDKKFRLDVGATLPEQIFKWSVNKGVLNATLTANCDQCGTQGTLIFSGHIEASLGFSGFDVDKFELSVRPESVEAHVGLSLEFVGQLDYTGFIKPSQEFEILEIPVSGWNIKGIFEFGPRILLNAGYSLDYIEGEASVSTGITARIPNSAIAKLDLLAEDSVEVSGWTPVIETDPLAAQAQINSQARLYTEIALSVSLTVLDDNGFGVDLSLKVPEVTVTTSAGVNTEGFCENSDNPFGIMVESTVGASLALEGWKELDGDHDPLFEVELFKKDDLYVFPQFCFDFDTVTSGFCLAEESDEELIEEEANAVAERKRDTTALVSRQDPDKERKPIYPECDKTAASGADKHPVLVLQYPRPAAMRDDEGVPIAVPSIPCSKDSGPCKPSDGDVTIVLNSYDDDDDDRKNNKRSRVERDNRDWFVTEKQKRWDAEHVYEGFWVKKYIDHLAGLDVFKQEAGCHANLVQFWDAKLPPTNVEPPEDAPQPKTYMEAMLQHLGTIYNFHDTMAILRMTENNYKHRMFAKKQIVAYFENDEDNSDPPVPNDNNRRSCDLARIVSTCKYYNDPEIQKKARASVQGIESVLKVMDADTDNIKRPSGFSFKDAHFDFYNTTYYGGIQHARDALTAYAKWLNNNSGGLPQEVKDEVSGLASGNAAVLDEYCEFIPRDGW
ncbi:hypothetical protein FE257_008621 [Aspergillus nanangensis]|uniref:Uncharacterized protein n=1 Tax=Aspergillus nanangensis TaxID=2582783 RepID=A0AAD4CL42_ASPNN|nr:hypothetical protein FE257_008621 [Aspergillus nanangensis]